MKRIIKYIFIIVMLMIAATALLSAEYKFPPPEFESGYTLPLERFPQSRAFWLYWLDIIVLVLVILASAWASLKKRSRTVLVGISMFSLAYFGFYKEGCICPIGAISDISLALVDPLYFVSLTTILIFIIPLVSALFVGRAYCGGACPHGALQDLLLVKEVKVPRWLDRSLSVFAYAYLGAVVLFAVTNSYFLICRFDPFVPFFRLNGPFYMLVTGGIFIVTSMFIGRPYCRFICPYGALLKPLALVSVKKVTITPDECITCKLCADACPYSAINKAEKAGVKKNINGSLLITLILVGLIIGAFLGSYASVYGARQNNEVKIALELNAFDAGQIKQEALSLAAAESIKKGESRQIVYERAEKIQSAFKRGGAVLGLFLMLVLGIQVIYSLRRPRRDSYEPDGARCLSCGRCFMSCPVERSEKKK